MRFLILAMAWMVPEAYADPIAEADFRERMNVFAQWTQDPIIGLSDHDELGFDCRGRVVRGMTEQPVRVWGFVDSGYRNEFGQIRPFYKVYLTRNWDETESQIRTSFAFAVGNAQFEEPVVGRTAENAKVATILIESWRKTGRKLIDGFYEDILSSTSTSSASQKKTLLRVFRGFKVVQNRFHDEVKLFVQLMHQQPIEILFKGQCRFHRAWTDHGGW